mgnify:CR=1 FL=1
MADLEKVAGLLGRLDHALGLREVVGHLLLAVDLLAGLEAGVRVFGVPEVRRGHDDRVHAVLLLVQHLLVVFVHVLQDVMAVGVQPPAGVPLAVVPDVAQAGELDAGDLDGLLNEDPALGAGPDDAHVDGGGAGLFGAQDGGGDGESRSDRRRRLQESASVDALLRLGFVISAHRPRNLLWRLVSSFRSPRPRSGRRRGGIVTKFSPMPSTLRGILTAETTVSSPDSTAGQGDSPL